MRDFLREREGERRKREFFRVRERGRKREKRNEILIGTSETL